MLFKWIVATVSADQRAAFSESQQVWTALRHCEGFLGQVGGWSFDGRACIVGLWQDAGTYARFMAHTHDAILAADTGPPPFQKLDIHTSEVLVRWPGDLLAAARTARWLQVQDQRVSSEHANAHLSRALRERPDQLCQLETFLGGFVSGGTGDRFLEATLWRDGTADAIAATGETHRVALNPAWSVWVD